MQRLLLPASRASYAQPWLSKFFTFLPPLGEPNEDALRPTLLPADSCRTAGIETNGSAQNLPVCCRVQQTSLALKQRFLDCGLPRGTAASSEHRGSQGIKLTTDSGSVWMQASLRAAKTRPVPLTRLPLITRLLAATGSRHTTRPAHAVVVGHHTTVSSLSFIAYPQTWVPAPSALGPYAGATGVRPNPLLDCSNPILI